MDRTKTSIYTVLIFLHNCIVILEYHQSMHIKQWILACSRKKIMHVFIALLVDESTLQWIHPGNHHVPLFIESSKILVSSPHTGGFLKYRHLFTLR